MKVTISKRKVTGGKFSLRLQYYYGHAIVNGKVKHHRKIETLDIFIYEKPANAIEKQHNKEALQLAETIKAKRIVEHQTGKHNLKNVTRAHGTFNEFMQAMIAEKNSQSAIRTWSLALRHFENHFPNPITFDQLTPELLKDFRDYLLNRARIFGKPGRIKQNTAKTYFERVKYATTSAFNKGIIPSNPFADIDPIPLEATKRQYLTVDEVKALAKTPCKIDSLRRTFLFSCLVGMRFSDIKALDWQDVKSTDDGGLRLEFYHVKTKSLQYLDLPAEAIKLMGERYEVGRVFPGISNNNYQTYEIHRWCMAAGITKHITFHCARHTFAVTQLTNGCDIYTLSKLMGHSTVKITEIYADIIDEQRRNAMINIPTMGI